MKVESITLRELRLPLKHFFETSFGRTESRRVLLVTADCDGVEGWAECVASDGEALSITKVSGSFQQSAGFALAGCTDTVAYSRCSAWPAGTCPLTTGD